MDIKVQELFNITAVDQRIKIIKESPEGESKRSVYEGNTFDLMDGELLNSKVTYMCSTEDDELLLIV